MLDRFRLHPGNALEGNYRERERVRIPARSNALRCQSSLIKSASRELYFRRVIDQDTPRRVYARSRIAVSLLLSRAP